jgi:hypothetical protein
MDFKATYAKINLKAKTTYLERQKRADDSIKGKRVDVFSKNYADAQKPNTFTTSKISLSNQKKMFQIYENRFEPLANPTMLINTYKNSAPPGKGFAINH